VWLWVAIKARDKVILDIRISIERSRLIAEQFIQSLIRKYGKHNFQLIVGSGIYKHVDSLTWNISDILRLKKAS
jgi:transposase-like protein